MHHETKSVPDFVARAYVSGTSSMRSAVFSALDQSLSGLSIAGALAAVSAVNEEFSATFLAWREARPQDPWLSEFSVSFRIAVHRLCLTLDLATLKDLPEMSEPASDEILKALGDFSRIAEEWGIENRTQA